MFDTQLSTGAFAPRQVSGTVRAVLPDIFDSEMRWDDVVGLQIDTPFIEKHMIPCEDMRGWQYVDEEATMEEQDELMASEWKSEL